MDDRELIAMAAFRIAEAAKHLRTLAGHTHSSAVRKTLLGTARKLGHEASRMRSTPPPADGPEIVETCDAAPSLTADA